MPRIYETLSGHRIEYPDPSPKVQKFMDRVYALAEDPNSDPAALTALIYGAENPILEHGLFTGAVTRDVLENPIYHVLCDRLARKQADASGVTMEKLSKRFTLSVAEAAKAAGVTPDAIRKAIRTRRLPSWVKAGEYFVDPRALAALDFGTRGVRPACALSYRSGYDQDRKVFFRLKIPGGELPFDEIGNTGRVTRWQRIAVLTGGFSGARYFELEPGETEERLEWQRYFVEGKFHVARKENNAAAARQAFEEFSAS